MKASDFVRQYASKSPAAWETAALALARSGDIVAWPLRPVTFTDGARTLVVQVASDYLAVGEDGDVLRLPLTPITAQKVADVLHMLLPTPKMVKAIHEQANVKLSTAPLVPNRYANLAQYAQQNAAITGELGGRTGLVSGHKKDVVIGNQMRAGKVLIYGWMRPVVPPGVDAFPMMTAPWRVQPYSAVHGADYVDYSHGVRLVAPDAVLDGRPVHLADVLQDKNVARLVSDEGPLRTVRYDVPRGNTSVPTIPSAPRLVDQGLACVQERLLENKRESL